MQTAANERTSRLSQHLTKHICNAKIQRQRTVADGSYAMQAKHLREQNEALDEEIQDKQAEIGPLEDKKRRLTRCWPLQHCLVSCRSTLAHDCHCHQ